MPEPIVWDLVVIGGGSAGLVASKTAAGGGAKVLLIERERLGGDCLWTGCVPSKALIAAGHRASMVRDVGWTGAREWEADAFRSAMVSVQRAIEPPRIFHFGGLLTAERGVSDKALDALAGLGHKVGRAPVPHGGSQTIWIDRERGVLAGGSDPRKDGMAIGF